MSLQVNLDIAEEMYAKWKRNKESVDEAWANFFEGFTLGYGSGASPEKKAPATTEKSTDEATSHLQSKCTGAVFMYRIVGHTQANINPLRPPVKNERLSLQSLGLSPEDMEKMCDIGKYMAEGVSGGKIKVADLIAHLEATYCGKLGVEYTHIQDTQRRRWLQAYMESRKNEPRLDSSKRKRMLRKILNAEMFEQFVHSHFVGQKRFSLEGGETMIAALDNIINIAPQMGIKAYVIGMAHRGRLNVLTEIMGKSHKYLFKEFGEEYMPNTVYGSGDVKYHLGYDGLREINGQTVGLHLTPNPSHLEAVDPVAEGRARAMQRRLGDTQKRKAVVPVLIHGDAAFIGQGIVAETLNLSKLKGYTTGGTIHFVINNQIGFTTDPEEARSTYYCSDMAKMIEAPVLHVNGDEPDSVIYAIELALAYRQEFGDDVVIDMLCYRRYGHNEADEPRFTQPELYSKIDSHPLISQTYLKKLEAEGVTTAAELETWKQEQTQTLEKSYTQAKEKQFTMLPFGGGLGKNLWAGSSSAEAQARWNYDSVKTGVDLVRLEMLVDKLTTIPEGFAANPKIVRLNEQRKKNYQADKIDWGLGEQLAWATLLTEGTPVRISGQDCVRGTFSHRHAAWYDTRTNERYEALNHIDAHQAQFCAHNSSLSEAAVLGFDYGYSMDYPEMLCMWEAQFGDFANGAQSIIDQFIVSGESKWQVASGLTMLLPHGYEGQGPEHSSARLERYLQLCAQENIQVVYPTTPAQLYHLLRRQMKQAYRKPLIVMTPKSLLRLETCISARADFAPGRYFAEFIDEANEPRKIERVIVCSGKIYYDLAAYRAAKKREEVAIVRVEQLYPWHAKAWEGIAKKYGRADWIWCQEEPKNMGAWNHLRDDLAAPIKPQIQYVGRPAAASPAAGALALHKKEQAALIEEAYK